MVQAYLGIKPARKAEASSDIGGLIAEVMGAEGFTVKPEVLRKQPRG